MRRNRNTKIIATLGPASASEALIAALFEAGTDVFRLNFSHGSHADVQALFDIIRKLERRTGRPIGVMADLQGPKLRVGTFENGEVELKTGAKFRLELSRKKGNARRAPLPHPEVFTILKRGTELLCDDGRIRLKVLRRGKEFAETEVVTGGMLSDRKGVNVPGVVLPLSPLTKKDRRDLRFALKMGADWIALSFIQRPEDLAEVRKLIRGRAPVMVKLEKPSAVSRLEEIVELADAVMVARGDLGVEMPPEDVPSVQKQTIRLCRQAGKPVVVATQMLDSMVHAPAPTRAEASDVATAVYDGADAVMLSAETAAGDYPVEAAAMMNRIVERVERDPLYRRLMDANHPAPEATTSDAISAAARQVAHTIAVSAIVTYTTSGSTTLRAARERPEVPILCLTSKVETARRLAVVWGVHCVHTADVRNFGDMVDKARRVAAQEGFAAKDDRLAITAGVPFGTPGSTNVLRIASIQA
jgi:pyruvate kinase